jgi:hypothetical protein
LLNTLKYKDKIRVLFIPVFIVVAAGFFISYQMFVKSLRIEHQERLMRTSQLTANNVSLSQKELMKMVRLFQTNRTLIEYLYITTVLGGDREPLGDLLRPIYNSLQVDSILLYDDKGRLVYELDSFPVSDPAEHTRKIFSESILYGFQGIHDSIEIAAAGPLIGSDRISGHMKTVGYIQVGKYVNKAYLKGLKELSGSEILFLKGRAVVASSSDEAHVAFEPLRENVMLQGRRHSFTVKPIADMDGEALGSMVVAISEEELVNAITKLKLSMTGLFCAALAVFLGISMLFIKTLEAPLRNIVSFINKIAQGNFDKDLDVRGKDEIAIVSSQLNGMQEQLRMNKELLAKYTESLENAVMERTAQLESVQKQLLHSQKMDAIGKMAGGIAHDFNNLLTVIMGYGELMAVNTEEGDPRRVHIDQIISAAAKAAQLVGSLLTFSRQQVLNPKPVDLNEIIRHMQKIFERLIREDIELKLDLFSGPLTVVADRGQIEQVLMNLVTNARDAMDNGGILTIGTKVRTPENSALENGECQGLEDYAVISVSDTGRGMDSDTREKIFEPFFTTKKVGQGTGLGLSIVYGIIKKHEGCINVKSSVGRGTIFNIFLPLTKKEARELIPEPILHSDGGTETLLLAEDDRPLRTLLSNILRDQGYTVIETQDGDEAVRIFRERPEAVQLFVADIIMPKKNGREAFEEIRNIRPDIKVIFMSGYAGDIINPDSLKGENIYFLAKPINSQTLLKTVRYMLDGNIASI